MSDGTRTRDRLDHNQELYQLSYAHHCALRVTWYAAFGSGAGGGATRGASSVRRPGLAPPRQLVGNGRGPGLRPHPPPPATTDAPRRWWGRHGAELRWQAELGRLLIDPVYAGKGVPRGNGGPVMLIPGFMAGDSSMSVMAGWLERMGHAPHRSGIAWNVGCSNTAINALEARAERIAPTRGGSSP